MAKTLLRQLETRLAVATMAHPLSRETVAARRIVAWAKVYYPPDAARPLIEHLTAEGLATREEIGRSRLQELASLLLPRKAPATRGTQTEQTADCKTGSKVDGKAKGSSSKRGPRTRYSAEDDQKLAADWRAAKASGTRKPEFVKARGITQKVLDAALARVRNRKN